MIPQSLKDELRYIRGQKNLWRRKEDDIIRFIQQQCPHQKVKAVKRLLPSVSAVGYHPMDTVACVNVKYKCVDCGKVFK